MGTSGRWMPGEGSPGPGRKRAVPRAPGIERSMNPPKKNDPKTPEVDVPGPSKLPPTGRETTPPPGPPTGPKAQTVLSQPSSRPGTAEAGAGDPLKTMMPAGESGSRNPTRNRQA